MKKMFFILPLLIISLSANIYFFMNNFIKENELRSIKKDFKELQNVIYDINNVIPKTNPSVTKEELKNILEKQFPEDKVEVLDEHIRWRFFNFWFSDNKITEITYGS